MTTSDEVIDELVKMMHGGSDDRAKHQYRVNLHMLVELAKSEQRRELNMRFPFDPPCQEQRTRH